MKNLGRIPDGGGDRVLGRATAQAHRDRRTGHGYLYDLVLDFASFYEACHVLGTEEPIRSNRLALCQLTARTLQHGLDLLGITAPDACKRASRTNGPSAI